MENTGSVKNVIPAICTRDVDCPNHVTVISEYDDLTFSGMGVDGVVDCLVDGREEVAKGPVLDASNCSQPSSLEGEEALVDSAISVVFKAEETRRVEEADAEGIELECQLCFRMRT